MKTTQPPAAGADARALPASAPGHWITEEGREMAIEYLSRTRESLCMGDRPDFALANDVFMVDRSAIDLIAYQTAAKERIRWLSAQLAFARSSPSTHVAEHLAVANAEPGEAVPCPRCGGCGEQDAGGGRCIVCHGSGIDPGEGEAREGVSALDVLADLSSYVGAGIGDERTTPEQYGERIRWGIDHLCSVASQKGTTNA